LKRKTETGECHNQTRVAKFSRSQRLKIICVFFFVVLGFLCSPPSFVVFWVVGGFGWLGGWLWWFLPIPKTLKWAVQLAKKNTGPAILRAKERRKCEKKKSYSSLWNEKGTPQGWKKCRTAVLPVESGHNQDDGGGGGLFRNQEGKSLKKSNEIQE